MTGRNPEKPGRNSAESGTEWAKSNMLMERGAHVAERGQHLVDPFPTFGRSRHGFDRSRHTNLAELANLDEHPLPRTQPTSGRTLWSGLGPPSSDPTLAAPDKPDQKQRVRIMVLLCIPAALSVRPKLMESPSFVHDDVVIGRRDPTLESSDSMLCAKFHPEFGKKAAVEAYAACPSLGSAQTVDQISIG